MISISAQAFALDALYAAVKERIPPRSDLEEAWNANRTARYVRIAEVFRMVTKMDNEAVGQARLILKHAFKYRDWAVHPPADFRNPIYYDVLDAGVEWRFVVFSAQNSGEILKGVVQLINYVLTRPRLKFADLARWAESSVALIPPAAQPFLLARGAESAPTVEEAK